MSTDPGIHDTEPAVRPVKTDPGLGVVVREAVEQATATVTEPTPPSPPPSDVAPGRAARAGGDSTPVPPETDGLLSGLIASENEAYFRKAKPGSQSSGEAAAAFHGQPRAVAPGNPTPPPEPPVLLRRSVELELANPPPPLERAQRDTDPPARVRPAPETLPEPTVPLPAPRGAWTDRAIAFGLAALAVGALGIIAVRWIGGSEPASSTRPVTTSTAAPPVAQAPPGPAIPPPPAVVPPPPAIDPTSLSAEPQSVPETPLSRPGKAPRTPPGSRHVAGQAGSAAPGEVLPPPKDDVKRSM